MNYQVLRPKPHSPWRLLLPIFLLSIRYPEGLPLRRLLGFVQLWDQDLSPPRPASRSACGAARSYRRETLPSSAGRCRTDDHKTAWTRLPKSVQPWQNCSEPVRLVSASLQFSICSVFRITGKLARPNRAGGGNNAIANLAEAFYQTGTDAL